MSTKDLTELLPREMQQAILDRADLLGRIRAERVCRGWRALSRQSWKNLTALKLEDGFLRAESTDGKMSFQLSLADMPVPRSALEAILNRCGPALTTFQMENTSCHLVRLDSGLARQLTKLAGLTLSSITLRKCAIQIYAGPMDEELLYFRDLFGLGSLRQLTVASCTQMEERLLSPALSSLRGAKSMEELHLEDAPLSMRSLTGICRAIGPTLSKLCLKFDLCAYSGDCLAGALSLLPNITDANLGYHRPANRVVSSALNDADAERVAKSWPLLRTLSLRSGRNLTHKGAKAFLEHCPHLTALNLNRCERIGPDLLKAWVAGPGVRIFAYETGITEPETAPRRMKLLLKPEDQDESEFFGEETQEASLPTDDTQEFLSDSESDDSDD